MSYLLEFPYLTPETSEAKMFIQWKGIEACMDFYCPCGTDGHIDAMGVSYVGCPSCGTVYEMGTQVIARKVSAPECRVTVMDVDPN